MAPLAPLTFLVGENSTGKSTVLALSRIAWDVARGWSEPDFNEEPFHMGSYDDVAHYHGGQGKRAKAFAIGTTFRRRVNAKDLAIRVDCEFTRMEGQPALTSLSIRPEGDGYAIHGTTDSSGMQISLATPSGERRIDGREAFATAEVSVRRIFAALDHEWFSQQSDRRSTKSGKVPADDLKELRRLIRALRSPPRRLGDPTGRPYAIAPVRTKPRRTYDPLKDTPRPGGDHVPMVMARLSSVDPDAWNEMAGSLEQFGKDSGLFTSVRVRRFGTGEGDPFQLHVRMKGQRKDANIVDVGYGVSQVLPVLVDCLSHRRRGTFLMQQPEVHLHPKAQAELATFLCRLKKARGHRFVVETHSDHLLDRVRQEARAGKLIQSSDVAILFLSRVGPRVNIHSMRLNQNGELIDQPESYRQFFVDEQLRLLGVRRPR